VLALGFGDAGSAVDDP